MASCEKTLKKVKGCTRVLKGTPSGYRSRKKLGDLKSVGPAEEPVEHACKGVTKVSEKEERASLKIETRLRRSGENRARTTPVFQGREGREIKKQT